MVDRLLRFHLLLWPLRTRAGLDAASVVDQLSPALGAQRTNSFWGRPDQRMNSACERAFGGRPFQNTDTECTVSGIHIHDTRLWHEVPNMRLLFDHP
ncbi:uncharacterized protein SCHCODRAFT_02273845 [Schizophyllum commune H4-8]|uniref:uncharacterized protein n=1 Tax=Schizophyllum commune (strain H4-8 / FGSC 9210) TaxID=578458 RepID=UPI00215F2B94|nr:uncharacterized protein SCHCODRAFT_02273845 [Schizophyllum commune H4-8]KAI5894309.1 hypothetical protein SCHCODRAFT_02273845 [Schizophyllum commune H4-8]